MKPQLLEDIGDSRDSQSAPDIRSNLRTSKVIPISLKAASAPLPRTHFGVWRDRQVTEAPTEDKLSTVPDEHEVVSPSAKDKLSANRAEKSRVPTLDENLVIAPLQPDSNGLGSATSRFGRLATWTAAATALALVAGSSLWLYKDRKDEATLAIVAGNLKGEPAAARPVPAARVAQPVITAQPEKLPPLVLLKPIEVAKVEPETVLEVKVPETQAETESTPVLEEPAKARAQLRKGRRTASAVRAQPRRVTAMAERPSDVSPTAALSKACRALGYHEAQCRKRACVLTKFGLACKG